MNLKLEKFTNYLKKSFYELKNVKWLTRRETVNLTIEVVAFSLIFIIIYGLFDSFIVKLLLLLK